MDVGDLLCSFDSHRLKKCVTEFLGVKYLS